MFIVTLKSINRPKILMMENNVPLKTILKSFVKKLYALNTFLRETYRIKELLKGLTEDYKEIKKLLREHPELDSYIKEFVREQELLPAVKDVKAKYSVILDMMKDAYHDVIDMDMLFERYRDYRYYYIPDERLPSFIASLFSKDDTVIFRQVISRKPFDEEFVNTFGAKRMDSFSILVPSSMLEDLIVQFLKIYSTSFSVEGEDMYLVFKPEHGLVKVRFKSVEDIPAVDRLVRSFEGEPIDI